MNNEDEDELAEFEFDSSDSKSSSKRYPLVQNFKSVKSDVESDIRKIFDEMKAQYSKWITNFYQISSLFIKIEFIIFKYSI